MIKIHTSLRTFFLICFFFISASILSAKIQAATYSMSPASGALISGCQESVSVLVDATGESSNAADLIVNYDPTQINIVNTNLNPPNVTVQPGNAYESYVYNKVDTTTGTIRLAAGSFSSVLSSKKVFATILFKSLSGVTSAGFTIQFAGVGSTKTSNVADSNTNLNLLTAVSNATYTFTTGSCLKDTTPPTVNFISPYNFQLNFPTSGNIVIDVNDDLSGVDLTSLVFNIAGTQYKVGDPQVTYTGNPLSYQFTINTGPLPSNQSLFITVNGADIAGNKMSPQQAVFNIPASIISTIVSYVNTVCNVNNTPPFAGINPSANSSTIGNLLLNNTDLLQNTPLKNTLIDKALSSIGIDGLAALILLLLNLLPFLTLLNAPGLLLNLLGVVLGKRVKKPWGVITDSITGKPVPFAVCRLFKSGTTFVNLQTVSDLDGRYGFTAGEGEYRMEIIKEGYTTFKKEIKINDKEDNYIFDVLLQPIALRTGYNKGIFKSIGNFFGVLYNKLRVPLMTIGFIVSILSVLISPNIFNFIICAIYIVIGVAYLISEFNRRAKYSAVIDSKTNLRIPFAIVKIFDADAWKLVDTQVTNSNGQFDFYGEPGEYAILVTVRGYKFPSVNSNNLPLVKGKYDSMVKAYLKKGGNKVSLYVDPIEGNNLLQSDLAGGANLQTPFGS